MLPAPNIASCGPWGKAITLTPKQRLMLHWLLHRELRKCTSSTLEASRRLGWSSGPGTGHELTALGRRMAEFSEQALPDRPLEIPLP